MALTRRFIELAETPSTNTALRQLLAGDPSLPAGSVLFTHHQTAGRGQRGNTWEAEPGMNVTMSMLLRPHGVKARDQFAVSECVALAVATVAGRYLPAYKVEVKWPNDIYVGDKKLCGILIENSLAGDSIDYSIAGIGLNVNQREFRSDAPNPVSIFQLAGVDSDPERIIAEIADEIEQLMSQPVADVHELYCGSLWRRKGIHRYLTADGEQLMAEIAGVGLDGILSLREAGGPVRSFAFKEVSAVL